MADRTGLEPATSGVTGRHSNQLNYRSTCINLYVPITRTCVNGGWYRVRTCDPQLVRLVLSQLS